MSRALQVTPPPPSPAEGAVATLAFVTVTLTIWGYAGRAFWAPPTFGILSFVTALVAVILTRKEKIPFHFWAFAPAGLFVLLVGASLLNLSFTPLPDKPGSLILNTDEIKWLPSTVLRSMTLEKALPWLSALLLGAALRQVELGRRATRLFWAALLAQGLLLALVGIYFHYTDPMHMFGMQRDLNGYHFASFAYRNNWAAFALMLMFLALGFAFSALQRWQAGRGRFDATLAGFGAAILLAITMPMPGSRSGTLMALGLLLVAAGIFVRTVWRSPLLRRSNTERARYVAALIVCMGAFGTVGALMNQDAISKHWRRTQQQLRSVAAGDGDLRVKVTMDTLRMGAERPIWGWGVGSYSLVFPNYQGSYMRDSTGKLTGRFVHAHNDWAHLWAETGTLGFLILLIPAGYLLRRGFRAESALLRWGTAGSASIMVYALVDFPFHSPAMLLFWAVILPTAAPASEILPLKSKTPAPPPPSVEQDRNQLLERLNT